MWNFADMATKRRPIKRIDHDYKVGSGQAQTLDTPSQLTNLLLRAYRNEMGKRDVAIIWMLFGSGMRVNEVAQLKVKDVIYKNGELKKTFSLPAKYTKTNNSRAVYIVVRQQREALEVWIRQRLDEAGMLSSDGSYGGLRGDSPLFLVKKGGWHTLSFNFKRYKTKEGVKESLICSSLENLMRDVIKSSGIHAGSSRSKCIPVYCYPLSESTFNLAA